MAINRALEGLKVMELAEGWSGPLAARLLAELGADVVKIESPAGDWLRCAWPASRRGHSTAFELTSALKRSVVLDLRHDREAVDMLRHWVGSADVVLADETWTDSDGPLAWDALVAACPTTIFCSVTPFGRDGAHSKLAANDLTLQAVSGVMASTGFPGDPPTKAGPSLAHHVTALYSAAAILAALEERRRSQRGQVLDMAAYDCLFSYLFLFLSPLFANGAAPPRQGNRHLTCAPWNAFRCSDGWVQISTSTNHQWMTIAKICGRPELESDARFASTPARMRHIDDVDRAVGRWCEGRTVEQVLTALAPAGIPAAPIVRLNELLEDPQFIARQMLRRLVADDVEVVTSGSIYKLSRTPGAVDRPAPGLGEHTAEVRAAWDRTARTAASAHGRDAGPPTTGDTALDGLVVVELGGYGAGPFCTRLLAELGARVIKVEPPDGDPIRHFLPSIHGMGYPYHFYNLNKHDVTFELRNERDRDRLVALLATADVLLENLSPGALDQLGLGYADLSRRFPRLIYCTVSGFGRTGPYAQRKAYDTTVQAMSAVMSLTGRAERGPTKVGLSIADFMGPTAACGAILAALHERHRSGRGQHVDISMFDVMSWTTQSFWPAYLATGRVPAPDGDRHPTACPHGTFAARDGRVALGVERQEQWRALAALVAPDAPEMAALDTAERLQRRDEIERCVAAWVESGTAAQRVAACQGAGVPAAPVLEVGEVAASAQTFQRGLLVDVPDPRGHLIRVIQSAFRMSRTPGRIERGGPDLGEHNQSLLGPIEAASAPRRNGVTS